MAPWPVMLTSGVSNVLQLYSQVVFAAPSNNLSMALCIRCCMCASVSRSSGSQSSSSSVNPGSIWTNGKRLWITDSRSDIMLHSTHLWTTLVASVRAVDLAEIFPALGHAEHVAPRIDHCLARSL